MKNVRYIAAAIAIFLTAIVLYIMSSTGFFRKIENSYSGDVTQVGIVGAEDFAISRSDSFLIISSTDRAGYRDGDAQPSGLYMMDLRDGDHSTIRLTDGRMPMNPHGIAIHPLDSSSYRILAISHVPQDDKKMDIVGTSLRHTIEEYTLQGDQLTHTKTYQDGAIYHPNDVVAINDTEYYFTNDHGAKTKLGLLAEDYLGWGKSNVVYYDGSDYHVVADGIAYANGIMIDHSRQLLYVASPRHMLVKVYDIESDMSLTYIEDIDCGTGVDNIELDENGTLWIGCHPNLLHFSAYAAGKKEYSPGEIITIDYKGKGNYEVKSVYTEDGRTMSGPTTAIPFDSLVYVGNVMDQHMIILDRKELLY